MKYLVIGICILLAAALGVTVSQILKNKKKAALVSPATATQIGPVRLRQGKPGLAIPMELLPMEAVPEGKQLVEITDSKVLAHLDNLIPGLAQAGNAINNARQATQRAGEVLYRAIIPAGAKLADSTAMEGAVRGIYHGPNGISGHADLLKVKAHEGTAVLTNTAAAAMSVASMVVGQYYMAQIHAELGKISDGISKISDFQDNEYRSKVFSLIVHVQTIADFQDEILENNELRFSKISQLDSLEVECTELLGQANLTLDGFSKRTDLNYEKYENALRDAQGWFMYQESLLGVLYKISELKYTLYFGAASRDQCSALLPTYTSQVDDTQARLTSWHQNAVKRLGIDTAEACRKRKGIDGVIHAIPGWFNDDFNFRSIAEDTAKMIDDQESGRHALHRQDTTDLYGKDVHIIVKDGKTYYLPEPEE